MKMISVVVPVFNAQATLVELTRSIRNTMETQSWKFELLLVDDGSNDKSWSVIEKLVDENDSIFGIKLSRNFGQHPAIFAGLSKARGEIVVVMDCDLQDSPSEIPKLINALDGAEVVLAQRVDRRDNFSRRLGSLLFYSFLSYMTGVEQDKTVANFGAYRKSVVDALLLSKESYKYFPTAVQWVGFNVVKIPVEHSKRAVGVSNYNFKKLLNLALDVTLSFSDKPLKMTLFLGLFLTITGVIFALFSVFQSLSTGVGSPGYASIIASIWAFSGINTLVMSVVGIYLGRVYSEVKRRPLFIIQKSTN